MAHKYKIEADRQVPYRIVPRDPFANGRIALQVLVGLRIGIKLIGLSIERDGTKQENAENLEKSDHVLKIKRLK